MTSPQGQLSLIFLFFADMFLLLCSLAAAIIVNFAPESDLGVSAYSIEFLSTRVKLSNAILGGVLLFVWHFCFKIYGLYYSYRLRSANEILKNLMKAVGSSAVALFIVAEIGGWDTVTLWTAFCFGFIGVSFNGGLRMGVYYLSRSFRRRGINTKSLLIIGGGNRAEHLIRKITSKSELGYNVLGYLDSEPLYSKRPVAGLPWLGKFEDLPKIINSQVVDEVAIALPIKSQYAQIKTAIAQLEEQGIIVHLLSDFFPHHLARVQAQEFQGLPLLSLQSAPPFNWRTEVKRLLDILISAFVLLVWTPIFVLIAVLIKLDSRGPVFFVQERMGYNKRRFYMFKFRTMVTDAEARLREIEHLNEKEGPIFKISNDPRITRVGKYLRKFSLDEFPQLINVLLGDMSLVGPRPLSIRDALNLEESWQKRRFSVKPGMTCLWQISGRSNLSFEEWVELDLEYIDTWSLQLDWWILMRTVPAVISARGAV
jgi:exopolysaccharide biosynthesis polyprenyl glycosylphosphotransferase